MLRDRAVLWVLAAEYKAELLQFQGGVNEFD
mgnify:CR=1 FL=1